MREGRGAAATRERVRASGPTACARPPRLLARAWLCPPHLNVNYFAHGVSCLSRLGLLLGAGCGLHSLRRCLSVMGECVSSADRTPARWRGRLRASFEPPPPRCQQAEAPAERRERARSRPASRCLPNFKRSACQIHALREAAGLLQCKHESMLNQHLVVRPRRTTAASGRRQRVRRMGMDRPC